MEFVKIEKCVVHIRLKFPNNADKYSELIKYEIKSKLKEQIDKVNEVFRDYTDGLLKLHDVRFKILKDDTGAKRAMPEDVLEVYKKIHNSKQIFFHGKDREDETEEPPKESHGSKQAIKDRIREQIRLILNEKPLKPLREALLRQFKANVKIVHKNDASPEDAVVDPAGPENGGVRVLRGGCWIGNGGSVRSAGRGRSGPGYRYGLIGFRLARGQKSREAE